MRRVDRLRGQPHTRLQGDNDTFAKRQAGSVSSQCVQIKSLGLAFLDLLECFIHEFGERRTRCGIVQDNFPRIRASVWENDHDFDGPLLRGSFGQPELAIVVDCLDCFHDNPGFSCIEAGAMVLMEI